MKATLVFLAIVCGTLALAADCPGKSKDLSKHLDSLEVLLKSKQIPFWWNTVDREYGGYILNHGPEGMLSQSVDKFIITQARQVWTFSWAHSAGYSTPKFNLLSAAESGFKFLSTKFLDPVNGGYFWSTDRQGQPTDRKKLLQGQAFIIIAFSEYFKASGDDLALTLAKDLMRKIKEKATDNENDFGGLYEDFTADWMPIAEPLFGGPIGTHGLKTANGVMHMMEALTGLLDAREDAEVRAFLVLILDKMVPKFYPGDPKKAVIARTYNGDVQGDVPVQRFGHYVEFTWIRHEARRVLGRRNDWRFFDRYMRHSLQNGMDSGTGGLLQDGNLDWWPQTEFMKMVAVDVRSKGKYRGRLVKILNLWECWFIQDTGISVGGISLEGDVTNPQMAGPWKSGFHEVRGMGALVEMRSRM